MKFDKVTPEHIRQYRSDILKSSSASTFDRKVFSLKKFFEWAVKEGYIDKNPVEVFLKEEADAVETKVAKIERQKKVYAPSYGSLQSRIIAKLAGKPKLQKAVYSLFYTRPKWYQTYHTLPIANYFNYGILVILMSALGFGIYTQFFKTTSAPLAYPSSLTRAGRYLSFQGRLTNILGNPITSATNVDFKLYNASASGTMLWDSGTCSITPDTDGIFSTLLGSSCGTEIAASVFSENAAVWLGVTVGADTEASPRVQIATVAYALNSETLQGYPASAAATANTVPVMNNSGQIVLAVSSPKIQSTSGNFAVEGQALTLNTQSGSGGSINIAPDGTGSATFTFSGATPGNGKGMLYATDANLNSRALIYGSVTNDSSGYNLLELASGTTPRTKFAIDSAGNATLSGTINGLAISGGNITSGAWNGSIISSQYGGTGANNSSAAQYSIPYYSATGVMGGALAPSTAGYILSTNSTGGAPSWIPASGVGTNYWQLANHVLAPTNAADYDLAIGGNATSSAKFQVLAGSGNLISSGNASISGSLTFGAGAGSIQATNKAHLTLGGATTGGIDFGSPITSGTWNGSAIGATYGGTGQTAYAIGDLLYADTTTSLAKLSDVATGNVLISGGLNTAPSWGKVVLGTHTTGNYVSSINGTANQISANVTTGDVTLSIPSDFRAPGTVNAVNGLYTGATAGTQRIDASGNLVNIANISASGYATISASLSVGTGVALAGPGNINASGKITGTAIYQGANQVCDTSGNCASIGNYWQLANHVLAPANAADYDLAVGGNSTASAKFQVFAANGNMTTAGTASVSGNLTLGNGSALQSAYGPLTLNYKSGANAWTAGLTLEDINGYVGIGTTNPLATLDVNGAASASGSLTFRSGAASIQTTTLSNLTIGGSTTGNVIINSKNSIALTANGANLTASGIVYFANGTTYYIDASGNANLNAGTFAGDVAVNGADLTTTTTGTATLFNTNATTLNVGGAANTLAFGAASSTTTFGSTTFTLGGNSTLNGGTASAGTMQINSTSNATKGNLSFNGTTTYIDGGGNLKVGGYATASASLALGNTNAAAGPGNLNMTGVLTVGGAINGLNISSGTITNATWNGNLITSQYGGTGANNSAAAQYAVPYYSATGVLGGAVAPSTAGYVLSTNSTGGAPTWIPMTVTGTNYWKLGAGTVSPFSDTLDVLFGNSATTSAKFAFTGVLTGIPTASISGSVANVATYLSGNGVLSTTNLANLTLGSSTTGNVIINSKGSTALTASGANLTAAGIMYFANGTTYYVDASGNANMNAGTFAGTLTANGNTQIGDATSDAFTVYPNTWNLTNSQPNFDLKGATVNAMSIETSLMSFDTSNTRVGIGTTSPTSLLDVAGAASVSGSLSFRTGAGSIQTTAMNPLTIGGATSGNITLNPSNAAAGGFVAPNTTNVTDLGTASLLWRNVYATSYYQGVNQVCDISGNCTSATDYWSIANGAIYPKSTSVDLLLGATATTSAKFAFINVLKNTPTASISGSTANVALFMDGNGNISTTNRANLTLGNSTTYNTTGNILLNPNGTGYVGIGTASPQSTLQLGAGQLLLPDGYAGGPSLSFTNNTNMGFYRKQNNVMAAVANGQEALMFSGDVGFGTMTIGNVVPVNEKLLITGSSIDYMRISSGNTENGEIFTIKQSGNVGIGITLPQQALDVNGYIRGQRFVDTSNSNYFLDPASATISAVLAGDASTSGALTFFGSNPSKINILNGNRLDFQMSVGGDLGLKSVVSIANNGFLGIGTTTPSSALDVAGGAIAGESTNVVTNGTFDADTNWTKGTGWTIGSGVATKTAGTGSTLSQDTGEASGIVYHISFTLAQTAGVLTVSIGGVTGGTSYQYTSGTPTTVQQYIYSTGTGDLTFTADASFAGYIDDVVVTKVLPSLANSTFRDSAGTLKSELRVAGTSNTFFGRGSGQYFLSGGYNTAFGSDALANFVSGYNNVAFGEWSLHDNITGSSNTALGENTLYSSINGDDNTAIGVDALSNATSPYRNIAIGVSSMKYAGDGMYNIAIGNQALEYANGSENIVIGEMSGSNVDTGSGNILVGTGIDLPSDVSDTLDIGNVLYATGLNTWGYTTVSTTGKIGIGTYAPTDELEVRQPSVNQSALTLRTVGSNTAGQYTGMLFSAADSSVTTDTYKKAGIFFALDSTGYGRGSLILSTNGVAGSANASTSDADLVITSTGNVGIGTTSPESQLHILSTTDPAKILVDGVGSVGPNFTGRRANGSIGSLTGVVTNDNLAIFGGVGYNGSAYSNTQGGLFIKAAENWTTGSNGTYISLSTTAIGSSTLSERLRVDPTGNVGIGTTSPQQALDVNGYIRGQRFVDTSSASYYIDPAAATVSAFLAGNIVNSGAFSITTNGSNGSITLDAGSGNVIIGDGSTSKLDAGTIDPPYTINGSKYATYVSSMTGVKEETTGTAMTSEFIPGQGYRTNLDFANAADGSDLWVFSNVTKLSQNADKLVVLLSPAANTKAWYSMDPSGKLYIYTSQPTTVSYRLTAPRFDAEKWQNTRDNGVAGFTIDNTNTWPALSEIPNMEQIDFNNYDLVASAEGTQKYNVVNSITGQLVQDVTELSQAIIGNIKAGVVVTKDLASNTFTSFQGTVDNMLIKSGLVAGRIQTKLISPLADSTDVTVQIGSEATPSGKFAIENSSGDTVASIDNIGNATFSGTLFADKINSKSLDDIQNMLTQVKVDQDLLAQASTWSINSTNSASLTQIATADLYVTNQAAVNSLSVTNSLTLGTDMVFGSSIDGQGTIINSLDTLTSPLKIQSLAMAPVEIMAGLIKIDTKGNVQIAGDLAVAGNIDSAGLTLKDNPNMATPSANLLTLQNSDGSTVSTVDASGSATFNTIMTQGLTIAGATANATASAVVNGAITTNATAGSAIIPAGTSEITIKNDKVTDYTLVYVTPTSSTNNYVLYVKSKGAGQFVVGFTNPIDTDVNFNWWIVKVSQ